MFVVELNFIPTTYNSLQHPLTRRKLCNREFLHEVIEDLVKEVLGRDCVAVRILECDNEPLGEI